ncbi:glycosyltransferase family 2 protein [Planococcus sp. CAU13]|uniref:glycosyltransferase family 2 protein n=1 Tax=Planococcus sp. CAU13 TaxID=1541197 RepID=UPI00052FDC52|nr:glycosyltransferase family 2 protein [Planococcus sp. CAU13]
MPKVSVIMPIYNKAERLRHSIESVLGQTYKDFELIMINDGSTDSSHEIALEFKRKDPRIVYFKQRNQGVSITRNNGIDLARGEFISFLDADDVWQPEFLSKMVWKAGETNVCYCAHYFTTERSSQKARFNFAEGDILERYLLNSCNPNTNSWLIRKDFLDRHGIRFSAGVSWGEDLIFFSKVLVHEMEVLAVRDYLTSYHIGQPDSLSENSMDKIKKDLEWMEAVKDYICTRVKESERRSRALSAIDSYRIAGAILYRVDRNIRLIDKKELKSILKTYDDFIRIFNLSNGLRSIKLMLLYLKVRMQLLV